MSGLGNARALLVAALIAGAMGPAYPDDFGGVRILAYGNNTCGSFVKSDPQVKQMYLAWVVGFITGSNAYAAGRDRLVGEHWDPNSTLLWLENYCSKDPLATFFTAADDFRRGACCAGPMIELMSTNKLSIKKIGARTEGPTAKTK